MTWSTRVTAALIEALLLSSIAAALPPASAPFLAPSAAAAAAPPRGPSLVSSEPGSRGSAQRADTGQAPIRLLARAEALDLGQPGRAAAAGFDFGASGTASGAAPMVMALAEQLGTSTATDPFTPDKSAHLFTMSDGAQIAIYFDGTDTVFRTHVGSWSAPTTLPMCCNRHHDQSAWTRNGDTVYGITAGSTSDVAAVWKLAYSAGAVTLSSNTVWCCNAPGRVFGAYWDATNQLMHVYYEMGSTFVLNAINSSLAQVYFANGIGGSAAATDAIAGDGTSVFYYGYTSGTNVTVVKVTASASAYTQRTEVGTPQLSVDGRGGSMIWDGSELLYVINDGDSKLRLLRRHAQDTYRPTTSRRPRSPRERNPRSRARARLATWYSSIQLLPGKRTARFATSLARAGCGTLR